MPQVMTAADLDRVVRRMAHEILERHHGADGVGLVGIHTRGVPIARAIRDGMSAVDGVVVPVGALDIGPYRDDAAVRSRESNGATDIPFRIEGASVVLVDDVLYTGRTIRAALDAISEMGRPAVVEVAVLVDRGHRELPIRAEYVGKNLPTSREERVTVRLAETDDSQGVWIERTKP